MDVLAHQRAAYRRDGFAVLPRWLDVRARTRLRAIVDRAAERCAGPCPEDTTNLAYLTDPRWFAGRDGDLRELLGWVARATADAALIAGDTAIFVNTQYFSEPRARSWNGDWHRDCQFMRGFAGEDAIRSASHGLHLRVALVDDDHLEIAPGSHARADTPEESRARRERLDVAVPARRIALRAGDGLLFHAWSVHRGRYLTGAPRRTFDLVLALGDGCRDCPPDCFPPPPPLMGLRADAQRFFRRSLRANGQTP
ncbi:MAG TPA: phytanoyl-CoA dioxygenase family protein [Planctomycetota bacterium]|nr:phytanoyl-CoA dioxygenase family protein [Planctomycetota bacterium]